MIKTLRRWLPLIEWLGEYRLSWLLRDGLAGLFVAVLLVPQAMAYALLADLPPQVGLYASIAPAVVYALFGSSRFLAIGPIALVSLLVADATAQAGAAIEPRQAALALAAIVATILILMSVLRLGFVVNFISDPVMIGFTSAAALLIGTSQLRSLFGLEVERGATLLESLEPVIQRLGEFHATTAALGLSTLLLLLLSERFGERGLRSLGVGAQARFFAAKAIPLLLLALGSALTWLLALETAAGVAVVGELGAGLPPLTLPPLSLDVWLALLPDAAAIALVIFVGASAIGKSLAGRRRRHIEPDQEALAVGLSNAAAACTGAYPVGASLSRSALSFDSGARTPLASIAVALVVLLAVLFLQPLFYHLPKALLAALVIAAVVGLFKLDSILRIWRYDRAEGVVLLFTFFAVLLAGVKIGLAFGVIAGIALYLWYTSRPRIILEGRLEDSDEYRSAERDGVTAETSPVLVLRIDQDLYFANTLYVEQRVLREIAEQAQLQCALLDLKAVNQIDASGLLMLERLADTLAEIGVTLAIAEAKKPVQAALEQAGLPHKLGAGGLYTRADEAIQALRAHSHCRASARD